MDKAFISKFVLEKRVLPVWRSDFLEAIKMVSEEIQKGTGKIPFVRLSFYRSSKGLEEFPELNTPSIITEIDNPKRIPFSAWHRADSVMARFSTAANGNIPPIKALVEPKKPDYLGISFEITECETGDKIAKGILHDNPTFQMWLPRNQS